MRVNPFFATRELGKYPLGWRNARYEYPRDSIAPLQSNMLDTPTRIDRCIQNVRGLVSTGWGCWTN